jgi:hypothetical protein
MAAANRTWGEERIASELLLKLGIRVSPRTVRRYMASGAGPRIRTGSQGWSTFVRTVLREWVAHYNRGRPHASLGPGIPDRPTEPIGERSDHHRLPGGYRVLATPILGGLHYEYRLEPAA